MGKYLQALTDSRAAIASLENWPIEFEWDLIGKVFQEGFDKSTKDWVIRMDLDYFFHEKDKNKLQNN